MAIYALPVNYAIDRKEKGDDGYFTVHWSPLYRADKYEIHQNVPAVGGVAEMYYREANGRFVLFRLARSWYGGIRAVLRQNTDPDEEKDPLMRAILESHKGEVYYRYATCDVLADIEDVLFFLYECFNPEKNPVEHSGRYEKIWLNEVDPPQKERL